MHGLVFNLLFMGCFSDATLCSAPHSRQLSSFLCAKVMHPTGSFCHAHGTKPSIIDTPPALALQRVQTAHFEGFQESFSSIACPDVVGSFE